MLSLIFGFVVLLVTATVFWRLLPRGDKRHRFVDTAWEPYIGVALCAGVALAFTMILSGTITLASG